jgi:hypothetical protein
LPGVSVPSEWQYVFEHCFVAEPLYVPPLIIETSATRFTWLPMFVIARSFPAETVALWHSEHSKFVPRYDAWFMCAAWSFVAIGPRPVAVVADALPPWHESHCGSVLAVHAMDVFAGGLAAFVPFEWQYVFAQVYAGAWL